MGLGIAQLFAQKNVSVILYDKFQNILEDALGKIYAQMNELVKQGFITEESIEGVLQNIKTTEDLEEVKNSWLVIEAIPEILELKQELLSQLETICDSTVIFASNTSGLPINMLAEKLEHPERFIGTHFFMPAQVVPLVEVIRNDKTSEQVSNKVMDFFKEIDKKPVLLKKDIPGFIGNRIQHAMAREAISLLEQGIASAEEIDTVVRWSIGVRMLFTGPLEQRDLNGLDVHHHIASYLYKDLENRTEPADLLAKKVANSELGIKTGKGFYEWDENQQKNISQEKNTKMLQLIHWVNQLEK
ncbi:3-hydroxyacyl-CoA dehydrogenase family protein [Bacillus sp. C11]|nr:3-hydroxyacyl-CoA dehydrogenase family protein [Neobacillus terrae]